MDFSINPTNAPGAPLSLTPRLLALFSSNEMILYMQVPAPLPSLPLSADRGRLAFVICCLRSVGPRSCISRVTTP